MGAQLAEKSGFDAVAGSSHYLQSRHLVSVFFLVDCGHLRELNGVATCASSLYPNLGAGLSLLTLDRA